MRRHPAVLAEAVMRRLGEGEVVGHVARIRQLERRAILAEEHEDLAVDFDGGLAPRMIFRRAGVLQRFFAEAIEDLFRCHCVNSAKPIILYSSRAPTFASHSLSPGATSQRSRPTICFFARRNARSKPIASFHERPPGTGVPVPGQSVGSSPSMSHDR